MAELNLPIIDPPPQAAYDLAVSRAWVKELKGLEKQGFDVQMYLVDAEKDLARLEKFRAKKSPA